MTLLCAALSGLAVALLLPRPAGAALAARLQTVDTDPARTRGGPWGLALVLVAAAGVAVGWFGAGPAGAVVAAAGVVVGATVGRLAWLRRQSRRAAASREEIAHACRVLAGQLRVGRIPADAVRVTAADCPVLDTAAALLDLGTDPVPHWRIEAVRPGHDGLLVLARAWSVSNRTGAPLAPALERVAGALSADLAVERLVSSEASAARATGKIMAALPVCGIGLGYLIGGSPLEFMLAGPLGWACLLGGVLLAAAGVLWIDALSRLSGESVAAR